MSQFFALLRCKLFFYNRPKGFLFGAKFLLMLFILAGVSLLAFVHVSPTASMQSSTSNQIGRLTSMGNGQRRTFYEYDTLGRVTRAAHKLDDNTQREFVTAYGYPHNPASTTGPGTVIVSESFPDGERVDYSYDTGGAQQTVRTTPFGGPTQNIVNKVLRNARGQISRVEYGNNAVTTYRYQGDDAGDVPSLRLKQSRTDISGVKQQEFFYTFDANGNVTGVTDGFNSVLTANYGYDSLDQLTSMTTPSNGTTLTYNYDKLGNLTNKEGATQTYGGAQSCTGCEPNRGPHALATSRGVTHNYDANGNLITSSDGTAITWNSENMATKVVQGGVTKYQKFFLGESLWKKVESGLTTYYLPSLRIENGQYRKFFGGFAERSPDGTIKFYHGDHLGSSSLVTDANGTVVRRQAYMPYGEDRYVSGVFSPKYQFNFKEKESTGFYDYGARLYNPATGRWLSADTMTVDGLNRYAYVSNNPLRYRDPTGHFQQDTIEAHKESWRVFLDAIGSVKMKNETLTIFLKGIYNDGMEPALDGKIKKYNKTNHAVGVPNANGAVDAAVPQNNDRAVNTFGKMLGTLRADKTLQPRVSIVTHSNGFMTLYEALRRSGTAINPSAITMIAPNAIGVTGSNLSRIDYVMSMTGNAKIKFILSTGDPFSGTFVTSARQLLRHFERGENTDPRVSISMVRLVNPIDGHQIHSIADALNNGGEVILMSGGRLSPEGARILGPGYRSRGTWIGSNR
jgi:RHS repeat-associated protein